MQSQANIYPSKCHDIATAKNFLWSKRGLTPKQADAELADLNDMQAGLLCCFYDVGLRGDDFRNFMAKFPEFIDVAKSQSNLPPSVKKIFIHLLKNDGFSPAEARDKIANKQKDRDIIELQTIETPYQRRRPK